MARHEMGTIQAGIVQRRDQGLARHGEFNDSRDGLQILDDRWQLVHDARINNSNTDASRVLTQRLLEMGGLILKFLEQFATKPLPTVLDFSSKKPTPDTDPTK